MNVAGPIRSRPVPLSAGKKRGDGRADSRTDAVDVDMYLDVPSFELSLDEFEEYALARLKVCRFPLQLVVLSFIFGQSGVIVFEANDHMMVSNIY